MVTKSVFIVFFSGERSKTKIEKICDSYGATKYALPEGGAAQATAQPVPGGFVEQFVQLFREPVTWYGVLIATVVGRLTAPLRVEDRVVENGPGASLLDSRLDDPDGKLGPVRFSFEGSRRAHSPRLTAWPGP